MKPRLPRERSAVANRLRPLAGFSVGLSTLLLAGCAGANRPSGVAPSGDAETIRPLAGAVGRVERVQSQLRFVVVDFRLDAPPQPDQPMAVYRDGQRVAELKSGYIRRETTVSADIISGEPREGDEVRVEQPILPAQ